MQNIISLISEEINNVNEALNNICDKHNYVYDALQDFINSPSKRIRSVLTILYLKSLEKKISPDIITMLCAGELIHNASLLHDDVLDDANTRRGIQTLHKQFSPKIAILCGDYLVSIATKKLAELNNNKILTIFQECTRKMSDSEIVQFINRRKFLDADTYIEICKGKTAALFVAILESAATLANIDELAAKNFGENFGILFQLKNDTEKYSAQLDKQNNIYTLKDILGIEKTNDLKDNYLERANTYITNMPQNIYNNALKDLITKYDG